MTETKANKNKDLYEVSNIVSPNLSTEPLSIPELNLVKTVA